MITLYELNINSEVTQIFLDDQMKVLMRIAHLMTVMRRTMPGLLY